MTSPQGALWVTGGRRCPFTAWEASGGYKQGSTGSDCPLKRSVPAATSWALVRPGRGRAVGGRPAGSGRGMGESSTQTWDGVKVTPRWQRAQVLMDTQPPGSQQPQAREPDLYPLPAKPRQSPEGHGGPHSRDAQSMARFMATECGCFWKRRNHEKPGPENRRQALGGVRRAFPQARREPAG